MDALAADADRTIAGEGVPEAAWRACTALLSTPTCTAEALLRGIHRLVVVAPHPDDEVLGAGALMAAARVLARPVHVLAATDGEACYADDPRWSATDMAAIRRGELRAALDVLDPRITVQHLGLPDGGLAKSRQALAAHIAQGLEPADLLLLPWRFDGHPDHEAAAHAGLAASAPLGIRTLEYPVWGWHWADADAMPWARALRIVASDAHRARKQAAIACFASQTGAPGFDVPAPILPPWALARFDRPFEVLFA